MIIEKPFDYVDTSVVASGHPQRNNLRLDGDGDFVLTGWRVISVGNLLAQVRLFRADGSDLALERLEFGSFFGGYNVNYHTIWPPELYPRNGSLGWEVQLPTGGPSTFTLLLRGRKRLPRSEAQICRYPERYREEYFEFPAYDVMAAGATIRNRPVDLARDTDFAIRAITFAQDNNFSTPGSLTYRFMDSDGWYYSNAGINWQFLLGTFTPEQPRAFVPEIYVPFRRLFLYDAVRGGAGSARFQLRFIGAKIWRADR